MSEELTKNTKIVKTVEKQDLSNMEKKIYNYIKLNPKKVMLMSLKKFSNELDVSGGTILNFCRKVLNLEGIAELKLQLAEDLSKPEATEPVVYNSFFESLENEYYELYESIKQDIDAKKFKQFNKLINSAREIIIYDTSNGGDARIAETLLYKKGVKYTRVIDNLHFDIKRVLDMKSDDVLFVISAGNEKLEGYKQLLEICDSKIISIVDDRLNFISRKSDLTFYTKVEEHENNFSASLTYLQILLSYLEINHNN